MDKRQMYSKLTWESTKDGMNIGNIYINNTGCTDDVALLSENPTEAQI